MRTHYPRHLEGFSYIGFHRYSLTFCTFNRAHIFVTHPIVRLVADQILRAAREKAFAVIAYCFMPDHVHVVPEGIAESSDLKAFIGLAKQYGGYHYTHETNQRLWQRYGYDHVIRRDERLQDVVRDVLENPVRAGLVTRIEDYPFIGSSIYDRAALIEFAYGRSG